MTATQRSNTTTTQTLRIQNGGGAGALDLNWTITETLSDCASPVDLAWVSVSSTSGVTSGGQSSPVSVTFNSNGLAAPNTRTGKLCINSIEVPITLRATYDFQGFSGKVKNEPAMNKVGAGSQVFVQFGLGGNQGTNIFASGSPSAVEVDCDTGAPNGGSEPAVGTLSYDTLTARYTYKWKTQGDWSAGTCRAFTMQLNDGTTHRALFRFE